MAGYNQQLKFTAQGEILTSPQATLEPTVKDESTLPATISAGGLQAPLGTSRVELQIQGGSVRYKSILPVVTNSTGWLAVEGTILELSIAEVPNFTSITASGTPVIAARWF